VSRIPPNLFNVTCSALKGLLPRHSNIPTSEYIMHGSRLSARPTPRTRSYSYVHSNHPSSNSPLQLRQARMGQPFAILVASYDKLRRAVAVFFAATTRQSDKYLASPPDGVTFAREIYYRVVHSRRRLLSKFQPNRTLSFVLTACGLGRFRGF